MGFRVVKHVIRGAGEVVEAIASFDSAVRAEEYARTLTNMEAVPVGVKIWFTTEPQSPQAESVITQVQPYRLTVRPLKDGFMNVLQDMRPLFPKQSGKITANLEGTGEKQLTFDSKNNRIFGLSKWYHDREARVGDYVAVTALRHNEYYLFQIIKPKTSFLPEPVKAGRLGISGTEAIERLERGLPHSSGVVLGGKILGLHVPEGEAQLEEAVIKNYRQALGEGTFYLPIKKLVGTELRKVTDGVLLDVADPQNPRFWIVEVELSSHDLESHVQKQLMGFLTALEEEKTKRDLLKTVSEYVNKHSDDMWNENYFVPAWEGAKTTPYELIDTMLHSEPGILVIIDEVTPKLQTLMGILSKLGPVKVVEFKTFRKDGESVHYFSHVADLKKR